MVTSGAIARGHAGARARPAAARDRRAPGGLSGRTGEPLPRLRGAARRRRRARRPGPADRVRPAAAHPLPERPPDAFGCLDWHVVPVVNENDTTATDEITFGDNDFLAAQVAVMLEARLLVLLTDQDGPTPATPAGTPTRSSSPTSATRPSWRGYEIGDRTSPFGLGGMRSKVVRRPDGRRRRDRRGDLQRTGGGPYVAAASGEPIGTPLPASPRAGLQLQALAALRSRLAACGSTRGPPRSCASAAAACCRSGSPRSTASSRRATRSRSLPTASRSARGSSTTPERAEPRRIKGLRTDKVRELLPHASEEAVHRDYFVLTWSEGATGASRFVRAGWRARPGRVQVVSEEEAGERARARPRDPEGGLRHGRALDRARPRPRRALGPQRERPGSRPGRRAADRRDPDPQLQAGLVQLLQALGGQGIDRASQLSSERILRNMALSGPQAAAGVDALINMTSSSTTGGPTRRRARTRTGRPSATRARSQPPRGPEAARIHRPQGPEETLEADVCMSGLAPAAP